MKSSSCFLAHCSQQLFEWKFISQIPTTDEIADPWSSANFFKESPASLRFEEDPALELVRYYFGRQSLRGGGVRAMTEVTMAKVSLPGSMDPNEWTWKVAVSTRWRLLGEHVNVNVLECRPSLSVDFALAPA